VTTVSPNYLNEINYSANGLESLFNMVRYKSGNIKRNRYQVWDPADKMLEKTIRSNFEKGKQLNKGILCTLFIFRPYKTAFSYRAIIRRKGGIYPRHQL
jgi:starch synthase